MHKVADAVRHATRVPLIHIAEATAAEIVKAGLKRPGLMATAYTMEQDFYVGALRAAGLEPVIPEAGDRAETHRIIHDELRRGVVREESRAAYEAIAARLIGRGADCLILGCTEVGMLLNEDNVPAPVFDTTLIHADAALDAALADESQDGPERYTLRNITRQVSSAGISSEAERWRTEATNSTVLPSGSLT
jgi:aspartate racemase